MAYKILYIEDLNPQSNVLEFEEYGYIVTSHAPESLETTMKFIDTNDYDAIVLDYKLTSGRNMNANKVYNAPTIAQTLRSKGIDRPIILMSSQKAIAKYNEDYTSQDLFDYSFSKEDFIDDVIKYCKKIDALILAYQVLQDNRFDLQTSLNITNSEWKHLNYSFKEYANQPHIKKNAYTMCKFIHYELLRSIGPLIGEDVLSARLGIDKSSKDWNVILEKLEKFQYKGILSSIYKRWWWDGIEQWWNEFSSSHSLRQLSAGERVKIIQDNWGIESLKTSIPIKYAQSNKFWSICKITCLPIDPTIDGYGIQNPYTFTLPWQEKEYVSAYGVLNINPQWLKRLNGDDKKSIKEKVTTLKP